MKKTLYIVLALIMALSLVSCGSSDADRSDNTKDGVIGDGLDDLKDDLRDMGEDITGSMGTGGNNGTTGTNNGTGTNGTTGTNNGAGTNGNNGTTGTNGTNGTAGTGSANNGYVPGNGMNR